MLLWKKVQKDLMVLGKLFRPTRKLFIAARGAAGKGTGTTGWVLDGTSTNEAEVTLAASLTNCKLVIPITGVFAGDRIRKVYLQGRAESGGNNVVIVVDIRRHRAGAADDADSQIATRTLTTITANAALTEDISSVAVTDPTSGVEVLDGDLFYVLIDGTTGASTKIELMGVVAVVDQA